MQANHLRRLFVWPIAATTLLIANSAAADDSDPSAIEARLKALEADPTHRASIAEPAANARKAIKRVLDARAAGDAAHATELAALALDWAILSANVVRAAELEKELAAQHTKLLEVEQKRRRTETLLEATIAQRERTREELVRLKAANASRSAAVTKDARPASTTPEKPNETKARPQSSSTAPSGNSTPSKGPAASKDQVKP